MPPGQLYIVATPIGNMGDLTSRALKILSSADLVACEDTRTTGAMLMRLGLHRPLVAYHEHNEIATASYLTDLIAEGKNIALVSDAGTPAISDPGFRIVRECRRRGLSVVPIPGASALTTALCASGLPTHAFLFSGFLPPKSAARINFLKKHRSADYTLVLYESPYRIQKFADEILAQLGPDRVICIAKELTKIHERFLVGTAIAVNEQLKSISLKGEFIILIAPESFTL